MSKILLKKPIIAEVKISIQDIAEAFCEMDSDEQGDFFNLVAICFNSWGAYKCDFQIMEIQKRLSKAAKDIIKSLNISEP